jgi:DNA-binding NarL/FixJ family response regulator
MFNILLASTDRAFSEKIEKVFPDNLSLPCKNQNKINEALDGSSNVIFMDYNCIHNLRNVLPKAKVIIASNKYDLKKECLSVRLGAKGFITKDIEKKSLKKVIDVVNSGQVWMTRAVTAMVFKECSRIFRGSS